MPDFFLFAVLTGVTFLALLFPAILYIERAPLRERRAARLAVLLRSPTWWTTRSLADELGCSPPQIWPHLHAYDLQGLLDWDRAFLDRGGVVAFRGVR